jgi:hypothetical protein
VACAGTLGYVLTLQYLINSPAVARLNLLLIGGWIVTVVFLTGLYNVIVSGQVPEDTRDGVFFRFLVLCCALMVSTYSRLMEVSPVNRHLVRNIRTDGFLSSQAWQAFAPGGE